MCALLLYVTQWSSRVESSRDDRVRRWSYMSSHPDVFVDTIAEGVQRARFSKYAFLLESTMNAYYTARYCKLTKARTSPLLSSPLVALLFASIALYTIYPNSYPVLPFHIVWSAAGGRPARPEELRHRARASLRHPRSSRPHAARPQGEERPAAVGGALVERTRYTSRVQHKPRSIVLTCASRFPFILRRRQLSVEIVHRRSSGAFGFAFFLSALVTLFCKYTRTFRYFLIYIYIYRTRWRSRRWRDHCA